MTFISVFAMSGFEEVPLNLPSDAEPIPFASLSFLMHELIIEYVGCGGDDEPETYGASLLVMSEVMPFCTEMILRWFRSRFVTMRSVARLRLRMAVTFPFDFNATTQLIRTRLCRVCSKRTRGAIRLVMHYIDHHPREWNSLGHFLEHNRMPLPLPF